MTKKTLPCGGLKKIMTNILDTYGRYKELLMKDIEKLISTNKLGPEYARYWKFVDNLLSNEMILLNSFSMLSTIIIGLNPIPDQFILLAKGLMKSADRIKEVMEVLYMDSLNPNFLKKIEEKFETTEKPIKGSITLEKEYKFVEANKIHNIENIITMSP